ncbi:YdiU family protein [Agrobacterium sp. CNPSo 3708]|uniref:protein adenylyltransferase SelO n=1 Tax=Agrobacterium sp. CNPSo 3708 TaxID=3028150 RepID=UPI0023631ABB|nr:YdiU family protein [Agrobacterium sp. CNPSo 3708]MDD1500530.1 YdiU family protein [Agrobacterium sp. CNPSo 3708]
MRFDNSYTRLPERFTAAVLPTPVKAPQLIAFNRPLAEELGLDVEGMDDERLAAIFSGNAVPQGAEPLAMAYAGHQFGNFVPQLGDGRAILLGEVIDAKGRRRDIQLKGSGPTRFSRRGDGRAALGPVLREYIVSEAMFALGIPATRALAAVTTGERVQREIGLPGGVFTRVAASHIRVGTFQFFAAREDTEALKALSDYVIDRHYPEARQSETPYLAMLQAIAERQCDLICRWLMVGFIHGVMNTDNMAVSGETIDFGPCAFMDEYHPNKVFSSIDAQGRYAYNNQPGIAQWNIARLAECLIPLLDEDQDKAVDMANGVLADFAKTFPKRWISGMRTKLGLQTKAEGDEQLVQDLLALMQRSEVDYTLIFRRLCDAASDNAEPFRGMFIDLTAADEWLERWRGRAAQESRSGQERADAMRAVNPAIIPRNHRIEDVIAAAVEDNDFAPFHEMIKATARPFEELPEFSVYMQAPMNHERVFRTFCGT